ncbi:MAG: formyl transferase [Woeseia sp.]
MRIVLLGHYDIASNIALSLLATAMPQHRYSVMLSGTVPSTVPALAALSACERKLCDDLANSAGRQPGSLLSFEALAGRTESRVLALPEPNSPEGLEVLARSRPDLIISVRYRRILKEAALSIPELGVLNLHSGLLPEYKGVMATFWAMLNNEGFIGSTLHYVVDGSIDTGPIVARAAMPADRRRSYLANVLALYPAGCKRVVEAVRRLEHGEAVACRPQLPGGCYYSAPSGEKVLQFQQAGLRLFDGDELQQFLQERMTGEDPQR